MRSIPIHHDQYLHIKEQIVLHCEHNLPVLLHLCSSRPRPFLLYRCRSDSLHYRLKYTLTLDLQTLILSGKGHRLFGYLLPHAGGVQFLIEFLLVLGLDQVGGVAPEIVGEVIISLF